MTDGNGEATGGVLLVGSVPLGSADEVFQRVATELGDRLERRARRRDRAALGLDRVAVPGAQLAPRVRGLPAGCGSAPRRCPGCACATARSVGHARASTTSATRRRRSRRTARSPGCKRDGVIPPDVPVPGVAAHAAGAHRRVRRARGPGRDRAGLRGARCAELERDPRGDPARPARHPVGHELRVRHARRRHADAGSTTRAPASSSGWCGSGGSIPTGVQLGYHFCHGHERHHRDRPYDARPLVEMANALSLSLGRSLDWIHLPVRGGAASTSASSRRWRSCALRPETRALPRACSTPPTGVAGAAARIVAAQRFVRRLRRRHRLRLGPPPRPGRRCADRAAPRRVDRARRSGPPPGAPPFDWPEGCERIPDEDWTHATRSTRFGAAYDNVDHHGWYRNLDPTVERAGRTCCATATC